MIFSIIVLAAGKGTRMHSEKPKVFHEVGNLPMIYHVFYTSLSLNPKSLVTVLSQDLIPFKKDILQKFKKIEFVEQKKQLGTADAVKSALINKSLKKTDITIILYGDTPLVSRKTILDGLSKFKLNALDLCVLSMVPKNNKNFYGRLETEGKKLLNIVEYLDASSEQKKIKLCNSGIMLVKTKYLLEKIKEIKNNNKKKEFYLTDLVEIFNKAGLNVGYHQCNYEETLGVNDKKELSLVEKKFQKIMRNKFLKSGVTMIDPSTVFLSYDTSIGKDVIIYPNVCIGKNVKIGNNIKIKAFSHIENSEIRDNVEIGPFARTRDEVILEKGVKVGNFVEIKKSKIKKDVKISHLSYLGDSEIGNKTNIGAGAITCNFDGKKKHKTIVGDNCFIGSNTSLIAPIKVKENSIIGAGTAIDKDIPTGTVVYRKSELVRKNKKKK